MKLQPLTILASRIVLFSLIAAPTAIGQGGFVDCRQHLELSDSLGNPRTSGNLCELSCHLS
jgi:hypothetical protein